MTPEDAGIIHYFGAITLTVRPCMYVRLSFCNDTYLAQRVSSLKRLLQLNLIAKGLIHMFIYTEQRQKRCRISSGKVFWNFVIISLKSGKFHFHAPIGALVFL